LLLLIITKQKTKKYVKKEIDAGGRTSFYPSDPNRVMEFNEPTCLYLIIIKKFKKTLFINGEYRLTT
jgi:hypothetical protein